MEVGLKSFVLRGQICYSKTDKAIRVVDGGYLVCVEGKSEGVYESLPNEFAGLPIEDYGEAIIVPGLVDLHTHAPQFGYRGTGMDMPLLEWLDENAFPEESKFQDKNYAKKAYALFANKMKASATTRVSIFATRHVEASQLLMDLMEDTGLISYVGKVSMDRNASDTLVEASPEASNEATKYWIDQVKDAYQRTKPILTPRFIPTCSHELMKGLEGLQQAYGLPCQSHLSENMEEIEWVKTLAPRSEFYGHAYDQYGLFGKHCATIMAHCVYSSEREIALMKANDVFVAHCPSSNTNIVSGIAPIRKYMTEGLRVGLGSDMAGGFSESIFRAMSDAIQMSKMYKCYVDSKAPPLTIDEAFYLGTKGGGAFFGQVGSFDKGYECDAVILDDASLQTTVAMSTKQRLERLIYLGDDRHIIGKYVQGRQLF